MLRKLATSMIMALLAALPVLIPVHAQASTYVVSGRVTTSGGKAVSGVTLTMDGITVTTAANGVYTYTTVLTGSYTIVPLKAGCTFTPTSRTVVITTASVGEVNFQAACTYTIGGSVTDAAGDPLAGATVSALQSAGTVQTAVTDNLGVFSLSGLADGEYWITSAKSGYAFANGAFAIQVPESLAVPSGFFVGETVSQTYAAVGAIYDQWGIPLSGVTVSDEHGNIVVTDASGIFQINSLTAGVHRLAASKRGYYFSPLQRFVSVPPPAAGVVFIGISRPETTISLSGSIQDPLAVTDRAGMSALADIHPGMTPIQTVNPGYPFYPPNRTVSLPRDSGGQVFKAHE